jgi:signal transduction histidine kinase
MFARELVAVEPSRSRPSPATNRQEGLLHDARNLVGTIGLYCDLLSMPGVLKPEHRQYPEELRLLGARSKSLIEHLMQSLFALEVEASLPTSTLGTDAADLPAKEGMKTRRSGGGRENALQPVSLRRVVERCSGLLRRVANGRAIEITYGPAATVPVNVSEEAVERILVNLVRNAAAALGDPSPVSGRLGDEAAESAHQAICIVVGPMISRVGGHKPWPFQRVRLVVEDEGCGMNSQQLERLLGAKGTISGGGHGIGFGVVRDLVAASDGEIRVMSEPEMGTCVQVEWPIVAMSATDTEKIDTLDLAPVASRPKQYPAAGTPDATSQRLVSSRPGARMEVTL